MQTRTRRCLMCLWERSLLRPFLCYNLEAHVDAIRSFCSTLKSVNTGSRGGGGGGGRDTQEEQERVRRRDREREDLRRKTSGSGRSNFIPTDSRLPVNHNSPIKMILTP